MRPDWYNRSVLDAEHQADRFTRAGRTGVVLRFGFLYGPGDDMTLMLVDAVRRGWYPLLGAADGYSSWVTHEDAAAAIVAALDVPAGVYNVVDDQPLRRRELGRRGRAARRGQAAPAPARLGRGARWPGQPDPRAFSTDLEPEAPEGERMAAKVPDGPGRVRRGDRGEVGEDHAPRWPKRR